MRLPHSLIFWFYKAVYDVCSVAHKFRSSGRSPSLAGGATQNHKSKPPSAPLDYILSLILQMLNIFMLTYISL